MPFRIIARSLPYCLHQSPASADYWHNQGAHSPYCSFRFGHALAAFATCSMWAAKRYLAYGIASAACASRLIKGAYCPSDVFWSAVIGIIHRRQALKGNANLLSAALKVGKPGEKFCSWLRRV